MTNEFFAYAVEPTQDGFNVVMYDLESQPHLACFTKSEKIANKIMNYLDNLAMDEEKDLFDMESSN